MGRIAVIAIVVISLLAGAMIYWLQIYAFYKPATFRQGTEIRLTPLAGTAPEPIQVDNVTGIDSESSPIRFRACFRTPISLAMLRGTYRVFDRAEPLNAPGWFDCFDAAAIGAALEVGEAVAFLSEPGIHPGVDRVVAVFQDGRAYAWHQLQPEKVVLPASGQGDQD